jgi:hypothetical protein
MIKTRISNFLDFDCYNIVPSSCKYILDSNVVFVSGDSILQHRVSDSIALNSSSFLISRYSFIPIKRPSCSYLKYFSYIKSAGYENIDIYWNDDFIIILQITSYSKGKKSQLNSKSNEIANQLIYAQLNRRCLKINSKRNGEVFIPDSSPR